MRAPSKSDYTITVPKVGDFIVGRRTMGDHLKIGSRVSLLSGGAAGDDWWGMVVEAFATLPVLLVDGPDDFIKSLDLTADAPAGDDAIYSDMLAVLSAVLEQESTFRNESGVPSEGVGEVSGEDG